MSPSTDILVLQITVETLYDITAAMLRRICQVRAFEVVDLNFEMCLYEDYIHKRLSGPA